MATASSEGRRFPLIESLESRVEQGDGGALAALRRGLGKPPGAIAEVHRYVVPFIPVNAYRDTQDAYYIVASLFAAWHQSRSSVVGSQSSYGAAMRVLMNEDGASDSTEKRFEALLGAGWERVPELLKQGILLLSSEGVPLDWHLLLYHLTQWGHPDRWVQRRWAMDFWNRFESES